MTLFGLTLWQLWTYSMVAVGGVLVLGLVGALIGSWLKDGLVCNGCGEYLAHHNDDGTCP